MTEQNKLELCNAQELVEYQVLGGLLNIMELRRGFEWNQT